MWEHLARNLKGNNWAKSDFDIIIYLSVKPSLPISLAIDRGWKSDREIIYFKYIYLRDGVERTLIIFDYY